VSYRPGNTVISSGTGVGKNQVLFSLKMTDFVMLLFLNISVHRLR
jgi:hypothetical protein